MERNGEGEGSGLRPPAIVSPGNLGPDGARFELGAVWRIHEIGRHQIVEYVNDMSAAPSDPFGEHGRMRFAVYVDRKPVGLVCGTLDEALFGAVCAAHSSLRVYECLRPLAFGFERRLLAALKDALDADPARRPEGDGRASREIEFAEGRGDPDFEGSPPFAPRR